MSDGRRLPVYLVLDTSGSMSGEPIEAVRVGMKALVAELKGDPPGPGNRLPLSDHIQQQCPADCAIGGSDELSGANT